MRIDMSSAIAQIESTRKFWEQVSPSLPSSDNIQNFGVSIADIARALNEVDGLIRALVDVEVDAIMATQLKPGIDSVAASINNFFQAYGSNPAQISENIPSICGWLFSLKTQLAQLTPAKRYSPRIERELTDKIAVIEGWAVHINELKMSIENTKASANVALEMIENQQVSAATKFSEIQGVLTDIQACERAAATARTNAESAAASATTKSSEVAESAKDLADAVSKKDKLFAEFEERRKEIAGLLQNANKVGLAKSFQDKCKELTWIWRIWAVLFFFGITSLTWIGYSELLPLLLRDKLDPVSLGVRFMLTGPVIWFTWFAARQYAHVLRISEDYAFKEAAAMAFVGYRDEVAADPAMIQLLQENAIRNFGSNPAKLLLKKSDAASPLHDAFERAFEKIKLEDLIKLFKSKNE